MVNTDTLRNLYLMYSKMATTTTVGQEIGQADGQSAIDAFRSAIDKAYATVDFQKPALQDVSNAVKAMNTAYDAFFAHIAKPKANVWYNIVSASSSLAYEDQPIHMNTGNTSTKLAFGGYSEDKSMEEDALAAWRLVPIEGQDNAYAIQLMANGQYFGPYRGDGADNAPLLSHAKTAYNLIYNGNGAFRLRQADDNGYLNSLRADADNASVINADAVADDEQGWEFRAITNSDMQLRSLRTTPSRCSSCHSPLRETPLSRPLTRVSRPTPSRALPSTMRTRDSSSPTRPTLRQANR